MILNDKIGASVQVQIEEYALKLLKMALEGEETIRSIIIGDPTLSERKKLNDPELFNVFCEFNFFYLHLTDRFACGVLNEQQRGAFMAEIEKLNFALLIETVCKDWNPTEVEEMKEEVMRNFWRRMEEYSRYQKFFPASGKNTTADHLAECTLFWGFGDQITDLCGQPESLSILAAAIKASTIAMRELDIQGFVEKLK